MKVTVIQTGGTLVSPAVPNRGARRWGGAYTGLFQSRSSRIEVPVKCFLVESRGRRVLVDAGWSQRCETSQGAKDHMGFGLWFASEPVLAPGEGLAARLAHLGVEPDSIDAVLMTHLDVDHASGLADVRGARRFLVCREELRAANLRGARYNPRLWEDIPFETYPMTGDVRAPFGRSCDVFGDGSMIAYYTPTHSAGSVVLVAHSGGRFVIFTGDNGYNRASWDDLRLPGPLYNRANTLKALQWIAKMRQDPACAATLAAHDPEVAPGVMEV